MGRHQGQDSGAGPPEIAGGQGVSGEKAAFPSPISRAGEEKSMNRIDRVIEEVTSIVGSVRAAFSGEVCTNCGQPEGKHAHDGNWCPSYDEPWMYSKTLSFAPEFADRICDVCSLPQSRHVVGRFCLPRREAKTGPLTEFRPRGMERVCPTC